MFNYNLINPININYRNPKHNPLNADDGEFNGANSHEEPVSLDENSNGNRQFPNGNKIRVDYTNNKINIVQVVEDFKSTIAAINAPKEVADEVNMYLGLVENESKKENPSREIILSNLRNASKISDKFIQDSLKKPSTVVEDWVNALFLQKIDLKADPTYVNEAFKIQIPEKKTASAAPQGAATGYAANIQNNAPKYNQASQVVQSSYNPQQTDYSALKTNFAPQRNGFESPQSSSVSGEAELKAAPALDIVSHSSDFSNLQSGLNVYTIPQTQISLNEIKPIGQSGVLHIEGAKTQELQAIPAVPAEADVKHLEAQLQIAQEYEQNLNQTYSTAAAAESSTPAQSAAVSFEGEKAVYKISTADDVGNKKRPALTANLADNSEVPAIKPLSAEEKAAKTNFVRAKRIIKENGDPSGAIQLYDEALRLVENSGDTNLKAAIHFERGKVFDDFDYAELALNDFNNATKCTDDNLKAHAHLKMGRIYDDYVMFDPAVRQYSLALESAENACNPSGKTKALRSLAGVFAGRYDKENTEIFNSLALDAARETGNSRTIAKTCREAAQNFEYVGEDVKALKMYKEAAKVLYDSKNYELLSINYKDASDVMDRLGNEAKAMSLLSKAFQYRQKAELQAG